MRAASLAVAPPSNVRGGVSVTRKIRRTEERISFRDLARFAYGKNAVGIIATLAPADERTVKRWFARRARAPDRAVVLVFGEIMRRYG